MITLLVDGNYLLHRSIYAKDLAKLANRHGKPTGGFYGCMKTLHSLLYRFEVDRCIFAMDGGISARRRMIHPLYKGSRHRQPNDPHYAPPKDEDHHRAFSLQAAYLKRVLPHLGISFVRLKDCEGDDIIAEVVKRFVKPGVVYICSTDQDFYQLVGTTSVSEGNVHVRIYNPQAEWVLTERNFQDTVGYPQDQALLRKLIDGDGSDNFKGVPNVGKVWINKMLDSFEGEVVYPYDDFFFHCATMKGKRPAAVVDNVDVVLRNYELACLTMPLLSPAEIEQLGQSLTSKVSVDIVHVRKIFEELDLFSLTNTLHKWVIPFQRLLQ